MHIYILLVVVITIIVISYFTTERFTIPLHDFRNTITGDCIDKNINCLNNFNYQESMCLQKRIYNKQRLCNSITGIEPRAQNVDNPTDFTDF